MIKKLKSYNNDKGVILCPHAGGYAEQLYVSNIESNVYGVVYPSSKINFNTMCLEIAQTLHNKQIHEWSAIGSSMGGYVAFLVAHYYERYFYRTFRTLHLFGVGCPEELIATLNCNDFHGIVPTDLAILKTLQIDKKKILSPIFLHIGNDKFFDDSKTIEFWKNTTTNTLKVIYTEDDHLPSKDSLGGLNFQLRQHCCI